MKVIGLDGKTYSWAIHNSSPRTKQSKNHIRAKELLKTLYPFDIISEELKIPGSKLYCDFFVCSSKIMVEVHGEQHYTFTPHFQKDKMAFFKGKTRDKKKVEFCDLNEITYIELPHGEDDDEWTKRIRDAFSVE